MRSRKTDRKQTLTATTEVSSWRQRSLFDHEQLARLKKRRRPRERKETR
jgi:hypothetical protein